MKIADLDAHVLGYSNFVFISWAESNEFSFSELIIVSSFKLSQYLSIPFAIDDYAKDGRPEVVWLLCSFYREPLRSLIVKEV